MGNFIKGIDSIQRISLKFNKRDINFVLLVRKHIKNLTIFPKDL